MPEVVRTRGARVGEVSETIQGMAIAFLLRIPCAEKISVVDAMVDFYIKLII